MALTSYKFIDRPAATRALPTCGRRRAGLADKPSGQPAYLLGQALNRQGQILFRQHRMIARVANARHLAVQKRDGDGASLEWFHFDVPRRIG